MGEPQWLRWARALQAHGQNGLYYAQDPFDCERFAAVQGVAAEMLSAGSDVSLEVVDGLLAEQAGYATPKVDVRAAVFCEGRILLVRERSDRLWTLPGGWADVNESPAEAIEREVWEESGYRAKAIKLLALWDRSRHEHPPHAFYIYKIVFLCELVEGERADDAQGSNLETDGAGFFAEEALPPLSLGRVTGAQIARLFEHVRNPDLPADFD